ncbi:MAG: glycosyltransferase family 4 protein [Brevinema sp.]
MKILAINWRDPQHPEAGGAELHLDVILSFLAKKYDVTLLSTRTTKAKEEYSFHGYRVLKWGHPMFFHYTFRSMWKKFFSKQGYDVIIDDISKIGVMSPSFIKDTPILSIFHHVHGETLFQLLPYPMAFYVYWAERFALKKYLKTPMIVVSQSSKDELLSLYPYQNLNILPNGIEASFLLPRKNKKTPYQICSVGRLTKAKRLDLAIEVVAKLRNDFPDLKLIVAGKGPEENSLKALVQERDLSDFVIFKGFVSENEKKEILSSSEAFIFPSEKEGWGIVALEASAMETPVFGFQVQGIKDAVKNGVNGYLLPFADTELLAQKLSEYLNADEIQKQRLQASSLCYAKNFSWDKICQEFEIHLLNTISQ